MRIVLTVERYAPAIGGAERVVQRVAEGLASRGHTVHVVTGGDRASDEMAGVSVHRLPVSGNEVRGIRGDPEIVLELIDRIAPDLVFNYAAQTWAADCCFPLLDRESRPRMVIAPCGFSRLGSRRYAPYFAAMRERLRRYDALIFPSRSYQDWKFAADSGADPIYLVPNGADAPAPGGHLRSRVAGGSLVVTVGSHVRSKGHADFARAVRRLRRTHAVTGVIVAPPRRGTDVLRPCNPSCHVRGWLQPGIVLLDGGPPGVAADAMASADLFMFTSKLESGPLVVLEAMAAGTPWTSYDVGHVRELDGGLVTSGLRGTVTAAASILDGEHPDLGVRGRAAWESAHQWPDIIARYEAVFEEVLAGPPVAAR